MVPTLFSPLTEHFEHISYIKVLIISLFFICGQKYFKHKECICCLNEDDVQTAIIEGQKRMDRHLSDGRNGGKNRTAPSMGDLQKG